MPPRQGANPPPPPKSLNNVRAQINKKRRNLNTVATNHAFTLIRHYMPLYRPYQPERKGLPSKRPPCDMERQKFLAYARNWIAILKRNISNEQTRNKSWCTILRMTACALDRLYKRPSHRFNSAVGHDGMMMTMTEFARKGLKILWDYEKVPEYKDIEKILDVIDTASIMNKRNYEFPETRSEHLAELYPAFYRATQPIVNTRLFNIRTEQNKRNPNLITHNNANARTRTNCALDV